jgi:spore maturation protein CgeB
MKLVVFGLTISSSWGNGHATLWRGLIRSLSRRGWHVVFFERDATWYAGARDFWEIENGELVFYGDWEAVRASAARHVAEADAAVVTSYCPDGIAASELVWSAARPLKVFYDLDTPVTLSRLDRGDDTGYIGPRGLADFDLVLSYTGGAALDQLRTRLGARLTRPLYGHVDPAVHHPAAPRDIFASDLSYIGTYAEDRQAALVDLFVEPARMRPQKRFVIAGAQYPHEFPWAENIHFVRHLAPEQHPSFYSSSRMTLNITRRAMAEMGWCPSGRLFEAAACGAAILADWWEGLDEFFDPWSEIVVARNTAEAIYALDLGEDEQRRIGARARERVLAEHTSDRRAEQFERYLAEARDIAWRETALRA